VIGLVRICIRTELSVARCCWKREYRSVRL